jgi:hypothetical protein
VGTSGCNWSRPLIFDLAKSVPNRSGSKMSQKVKTKRRKKPKSVKIDGLGPEDIRRLRNAIRQVWRYSEAWKRVKKRSIGKDGFPFCEKCKAKVPKTYVDHVINCGDVDDGYIRRMFVPSSGLQALCKRCHDKKTAAEKRAMRVAKEDIADFF